MAKSRAQKKFANDGVTFDIDMEEVIDFMAAGNALGDVAKNPNYLDAVIDEAFHLADHNFNLSAAAYATTGAISHMYEWGTVGINKARTNVRPNPMSPTARLWNTFSEGSGLNRTVWFAYRPSFANVPKPTTRDTGMSSDVISMMRDHVFTWKSEVMEEGQTVTITPKRKFLLIPAYEQNRPYMRPHDIKRGYMLLQDSITTQPGASKQGNFTKYWLAYWNGEGVEILTESTNAMFKEDWEPEFMNSRTPRTLRPVNTFVVQQEVSKRAKVISKKVAAKANARRAKT